MWRFDILRKIPLHIHSDTHEIWFHFVDSIIDNRNVVSWVQISMELTILHRIIFETCKWNGAAAFWWKTAFNSIYLNASLQWALWFSRFFDTQRIEGFSRKLDDFDMEKTLECCRWRTKNKRILFMIKEKSLEIRKMTNFRKKNKFWRTTTQSEMNKEKFF